MNRFIFIFYGFFLLFCAQEAVALELGKEEKLRTPPVISGCPGNITEFITGCTTQVTWNEPTVNDVDGDLVSFESDYVSGDFFEPGVTMVTYTATDAAGGVTTCQFEVNVIMSCPSDITVNVNAGCNTIIGWSPPTVNCGDLILIASKDPSKPLPVGETTEVVYTLVNQSFVFLTSCKFFVTVNDNIAPTFSNCPSDFTVEANNNCQAVVNWPVPTASDNCSGAIIPTVSHAPGSTFTLGATLVTYTATDPSGNTKTCTFTVTVKDQTAPVFINLPDDIVVEAGASNCKAMVSWPTVLAEDNCAGPITIDKTHSSGNSFDMGVNPVVYTATDGAGNSNIQSFNITVVDATPPTVSACPGTIDIDASAQCQVAASWSAPNFNDKCDASLTITSTHNSGDLFDAGTTTVTYTATDDAGNETLCSFDVVVTDVSLPTFDSCPTDMTVSTGSACSAAVSWTVPMASDNCAAAVSIVSNFNPGDIFELGQTTVTYTATDDAGNSADCSFIVTVEDNTAPVFSNCPANLNLNANGNCEAIANWTPPTVADNCTSVLSVSESHQSGTAFPLGVTVVTYSTSDAAGNVASCAFEVIVTDNLAPVISNCPANIALIGDGNCGALATWTEPTISDNCDSAPTVTQSHTSGNRFPLGETLVRYVAIDKLGNESSCEFTVTVIDQIAPSVNNCPANINLSVGANACIVNASWNLPSFTDNCNTSLSVSSTHSPGDEFTIGTTTVIYTAEDASGNTTNCSFDVVVTDGIAPVFNTCPGNINLTANEECQAVANWAMPNVSDNCTSEVTISTSHNSGDNFAVGVTTVTYTATDASGNQSSCSFDVNVRDLANPSIVKCTDDILLAAGPDCQAVASWTPPEFSDCTELTISSNYQPDDIFTLGITEVIYTATDQNGKSSTCTFTVTVEDKTGPTVLSCVPNQFISINEKCNSPVEWELPIAEDNCSEIPSMSSTHQPGDVFDIGATTVVYTFTDEQGNSTVCDFVVTVEDNSVFEVSNCPEDMTVEINAADRAEVKWEEPDFIHNDCSEVVVTSNYSSGDTFDIGETVVEYVFTDGFDRTISCSFIVTVRIRELAVEVSDLLSPNGDGINDMWIVEGLQNFPNNEVIIVDKWGGLIYSAKRYDNQQVVWDGSNANGVKVPTGTYFYFIRVSTDSDSQEKKGFIEIVN